MPIIAAFTVGATSAQVQAWFLVAIASSLLHSTGAQQEMLFVVDRWNHRIMSWEVGGNAGKAVAGSASGGVYGQSLKLLSNPGGVDIANNGETIFVSDTDNHRIVRWREGDTEGEVVAGGNGKGSKPNQLNFPYGIVAGLGGASILVVDSENARVVVWFVGGKEASVIVAGGNGKGAKENQLDNPRGVAVGGTSVFVADSANHRVMLWKSEAYQGLIVAGGKGQGTGLHQLDSPQDVEVIMDGLEYEAVFVADAGNNRVVKWVPGDTKGVVVAGGNGKGARNDQLSYPSGVAVANGGDTLYVSDRINNRVMKWENGATAGTVVAGGNGVGRSPRQLTMPYDIVTWKGTTTSTTTRTETTATTVTVTSTTSTTSTLTTPSSTTSQTGTSLTTTTTSVTTATMSSTTGTTSPSTTQTSITTPVTTKTTATTSVSTITTPTATTTSTTPPITTEATTTNTKTTPTSTDTVTTTTTSGAATTTTTTTVVTFNFPGVSLNELNETDIATLKADLLKKMNNATGNGVNISSIFISLVDNDSSSGTSSGAADSNTGTANTNANNSSSDDIAAFVLLEPGPASNSAAAVALAFDKVDQQIEAGAFKVTVNGRDVTITQPSTRTYFVAVVVGPDNQLRLVQGNPTAADPCNSIACSILCEGECGWSRAAGQCKLGYTTTARMMQDELGNCTGVIGTSAVPPKPTAATIAGSVAGSIGVVALLVAAALICRAKAKSNEGGSFDFEQHLTVLHEEQKEIRAEVEGLNVVHGLQEAAGAGGAEGRPPPLPPLPPPRINAINREDLLVIDVLGSGNFGEVLKCTLNGTVVAVKVVKINAKKVASLSAPEIQAKLHKENISLGNEATIMMSLGTHPHVVQLIGVVRNKGPLMVVLQAEGGGDLKKVLGERETGRRQNGAPVNFAEKHRWVHEIASGMVHIAGKHIVHRDIAARNIMVSLSGTCKIADFGLARVMKKKKARHSSDEDEIYESYYRATNSYFPIRWTAPEGLRHSRFSTSSDVWSFAIVIVEIWRNGGKPYPDHNNRAVRYGLEMDQTFMHPNVGCPDELYGLMTDCWKQDPDARPTFAHILTRLEQTDGKLKRSSVQHFDRADSNDDDGYEKPVSTIERRVGMPSTTAITSTAGAVVMSPVFEFAERDADALLETTLL